MAKGGRQHRHRLGLWRAGRFFSFLYLVSAYICFKLMTLSLCYIYLPYSSFASLIDRLLIEHSSYFLEFVHYLLPVPNAWPSLVTFKWLLFDSKYYSISLSEDEESLD